MATTQYILMKNRQNMYIKTYAVLCFILTVIFLWYFIGNWNAYANKKTELSTNQDIIVQYKEKAALEKAEYEKNKITFDQLKTEISDKLNDIFPVGDNYTSLTRNLDDLEKDLAKSSDIFEISSIEYQTAALAKEYNILPVRMNIRSSEANFREFLRLIENSGALTEQVRLMEISSIKMNFENADDESSPDVISFTVQINAYYQ